MLLALPADSISSVQLPIIVIMRLACITVVLIVVVVTSIVRTRSGLAGTGSHFDDPELAFISSVSSGIR